VVECDDLGVIVWPVLVTFLVGGERAH
jgi:hypothetical protein